MWYIHTMKYYSSIKNNEIVPSSSTWIDLEIIILMKLDSERQISYATTYMWDLKKKKDANELICRTETDSETLKNLWLPKGTGQGKEGWTGILGWKCSKIRL